VTQSNPSYRKGDQLPVESVTWNDANRYCALIGGRLPREAEWEYAARGDAGITPSRYGDPDVVAWHSGNSGGTTHPVARKQPNAFGLYDMLGNVWEWVADSHAVDSVLRGGSSEVYPGNVRASTRSVVPPSDSTPNRGFRCAGEWPAPETTAAPSASPNVYRIGNGITGPALLDKVEPDYTEKARKAKLAGTVLLYMQIDTSGKAVNMRVLRSLGMGLDEKAMEAVKKWRFRPAFKDGQPVVVETQVEVNFRLM
jgi:TonB family protein